MTITLRPEHARFITQVIEAGTYQNADQVIEKALDMLRTEDEILQEEKQVVNDKIERAFAQFERGEFFTAEESRADLAARKAVWLSNRAR